MNLTARLLFIALMAISGCTHSSTRTVANALLPGLSQPVRVSSENNEAAEPAIAASPDGSIYVAWVNHAPQSQADVMIARFNGDNQSAGPAVRVNPEPGVATAWRGDPPTIAVAPDNTVFVGWTARVESESGHATNIYVSASRDHGQTFAAPVKVNDDTRPADHGMHSLAIAGDGRIYVAWLDERNLPAPMKDMKMDAKSGSKHMESNRELFIASSSDGGRTFSANQRVATNVCPCCKTALAVNTDGRLYLSWRQVLPGDFRHIAMASSMDKGKSFTAPVIVSDDQWVLAGCPVSGATLAVGADGNPRVLWYSEGKNGQTGLYWSESRDNGATFGPRQLVAGGTVRGTPVLLSRGTVLSAIWQGAETNSVMFAPITRAPASSDNYVVASRGELPAAAANDQKAFVTYLGKEAGRQDVWLVSMTKPGQ